MKSSRLFVLAAFAGVSLVMFAIAEEPATNPDAAADEQAIRAAVDKYFRGVVNADRELLEEAWQIPGAQMISVKKLGRPEPVFDVVPISVAIENWTRIQAKSSSGKVLSLDIVEGEMALVKFDFVYEHMHFVDYLTLFKLKDGWKIVNKSFVRIMPERAVPSKSESD